jgi:hypothetical protein
MLQISKFNKYTSILPPLENTTFKVSSDIYFVVYNLYYVDQNNDLGTHAGPIHRDEGSTL